MKKARTVENERAQAESRKPLDERRDQVFSVKLTLDEKRLLEETEARDWARDTLIRTAKRRTQE